MKTYTITEHEYEAIKDWVWTRLQMDGIRLGIAEKKRVYNSIDSVLERIETRAGEEYSGIYPHAVDGERLRLTEENLDA